MDKKQIEDAKRLLLELGAYNMDVPNELVGQLLNRSEYIIRESIF